MNIFQTSLYFSIILLITTTCYRHGKLEIDQTSKNTIKNYQSINSYSHNNHISDNFTIKYRIIPFNIGDTIVKIHIEEADKKSPINFVNVHQNEKTSRQAGTNMIKQHGGKLIYITHGDKGSRNITFKIKNNTYIVDPNRIFTEKGIKSTLTTYSKYSEEALIAVQKFANNLLEYVLEDDKTIVALHNNFNKSYSFNSYFEPPLSNDIAKIYKGQCNKQTNNCPNSGEFFYITSERVFDNLKNKKYFNIVLQNNKKIEDDGSLSVYTGKRGINYINTEAQHGRYQQQIKMLTALYDVLT